MPTWGDGGDPSLAVGMMRSQVGAVCRWRGETLGFGLEVGDLRSLTLGTREVEGGGFVGGEDGAADSTERLDFQMAVLAQRGTALATPPFVTQDFNVSFTVEGPLGGRDAGGGRLNASGVFSISSDDFRWVADGTCEDDIMGPWPLED